MTEDQARQINASILETRRDISALAQRVSTHIEAATGFMESTRAKRSISEDEHAFIKAMLLREQRRSERWNKVRTQTLGWSIIAALGAIAHQAYLHIARPVARKFGIEL